MALPTNAQSTAVKPPAAFQLLPVEVNANIAQHLDDQRLALFGQLCRDTRSAVYGDRSPLWRYKFAQHYDLVPGLCNNDLRMSYQYRRKVLRRGARFLTGKTAQEQQCAKVLRELIVESFASACMNGGATSKNLEAIETFALVPKESSNVRALLSNICHVKHTTSDNPLLVIYLMLSHLRFDLNSQLHNSSLGWWDTQKAMYSSAQMGPIFETKDKTKINIPWVLRAVNFFKHHFASDEKTDICRSYQDLCATDKIKAWRRPLISGAYTLGKEWKGAYAYLEQQELASLRGLTDDDDTDIFLDKFHGDDDQDGTFQTLTLDFNARRTRSRWPTMFENILHSLNHPSAKALAKEQTSTTATTGKRTTRAQHRTEPPVTTLSERSSPRNKIDPKPLSFNFQGSGRDGDKFYAAGWLNPLPEQQGIPGWMRWTMMKFFVEGEDPEDDSQSDDPFAMKGVKADPLDFIDTEALWAYEGVVLPGGEVVVGRWWSPQPDHEDAEEQYSGPFILWCVDE